MQDTEFHKIILEQLRRFDNNQIRIFDKLDEQGDTLSRLTTTVEIHKNYSVNLEKEQKEQREDIVVLKKDVHCISHHVDKVNNWIQILKPTKMKIAAITAIASILGGSEFVKSDIKALVAPTSVSAPVKSKPLEIEPTVQ